MLVELEEPSPQGLLTPFPAYPSGPRTHRSLAREGVGASRRRDPHLVPKGSPRAEAARQRPLSEQQLLLWGPNGDLAPCSWPELLEHESCPCCVVSDDALGLVAPSGS